MIIYPQKPIKLSSGEFKYFCYGKIKTIELCSTKMDGVYYCEELFVYFYDFRYVDTVLRSKSEVGLYNQYIFDTIVI
jgi:hypothetical protein